METEEGKNIYESDSDEGLVSDDSSDNSENTLLKGSSSPDEAKCNSFLTNSRNIVCQICQKVLSIYCCPRCEIRTCSLFCVKKHKELNECDGLRHRTKFLPMSSFRDVDLLSDYVFLEQTDHLRERAQSDWKSRERERPKHVTAMVREAQKRGVRLHVAPFGMTARLSNSSQYQFRERVIYWRVVWRFVDVGSIEVIEDRLHEETVVEEYLKNKLLEDPVWKSSLAPYFCSETPLQHWRIFLTLGQQAVSDPRYKAVDISKCMRENLVGAHIYEHPVMHVACRTPTIDDYTSRVMDVTAESIGISTIHFRQHDNKRNRKRNRGVLEAINSQEKNFYPDSPPTEIKMVCPSNPHDAVVPLQGSPHKLDDIETITTFSAVEEDEPKATNLKEDGIVSSDGECD